ncbi:MAG: ABC transporter ATP-binding protein [Chloroflexi bacterium]|nr:ABC transporter ATP-binding protein [Chloroflexota bacterium]
MSGSPRTEAAAVAMVAAADVSKVYDSDGGAGSVQALQGVSLTVERGEMVAIMGPSGCGKTTLLNRLSGLDTIDSGRVLIEGVDIATLSDHDRTLYRARRMGFVFQTYNLLPVLSAAENVELPLIVSGVGGPGARERALTALEMVGLRDRAEHWPGQLSGGERQRVTIARALVNNPAIVWADEPTGNLDSQMADDVMRLLEQLNREQRQTFVIVTHDPAIGARCDRIVRMRDGRIVGEDRPG